MQPDLAEVLAEAVHDAWMASKHDQGYDSRHAEWGEELMVPYDDLSDQAKDLDRATVEGVLAAVQRTGLRVVPESFVMSVLYSGSMEGDRLVALVREAEELLNG